MRNNDIGATDEITTLAKKMRAEVVDPLKDRAIDREMLPKDVNPDTAASYLLRMHSKEKILANPDEWRSIATKDFNKQIRQFAQSEQTRFGKDIAKERAKITKGAAERQTIADREIKGVEKEQKKLVALHEQRTKQRIASKKRAIGRTNEGTKAREKLSDDLAKFEDSLKAGPETKAFQDLEARIEKFRVFAKKVPAGKEIKEIEQRIFELETEQRIRAEELADKDYVENIVNELFLKLTGLDRQPLTFELVIAEHGPLKDRTWNIQDNLIADFLENDAEHLLEVYNRKMTGQILLHEQFDTVDFKVAKKPIQDEFNEFIKTVDPKDKTRVTKEFGRNLDDMKMLWELTNGTYRSAKDYDNIFISGLQNVRTINYMRLLGDVTRSSFADVGNIVLVNGFSRVFGDLLIPVIRNIRNLKPIIGELRDAGLVWEAVLNSRVQSLMEIGDPTARGTAFSRFLNNSSTIFTKMTGLVYWNDFMKAGAGILVQSRIIKNSHALAAGKTLSKQESGYMKLLGLSDEDMFAVSALQKEHGTTQKGLLLSGAEKWENNAIARRFRAALNKDVSSTIVTKGLADVPSFANSEIGKSIIQFQNFSFAAHQRITIRAAQRLAMGDLSVLQGITSLMAMGMFIAYLKSEEFKPGSTADWTADKWILEGADRSGVFPILMTLNNTWEKTGLPGLGTAAAAITGNEAKPISRYASRSVIESLAGPTFGTAVDTVLAINAIMSGDLTDNDIHRMRKLVPFQNLIGVRKIIDQFDPVVKQRRQ